MTINTFEDLKVWQKAHELVLGIYDITRDFPKEENYGLTQQMRRSASSIPTNIAEGYRRQSKKDLLNFLNMANGSLEETKYHLILGKDLKYLKEYNFKELKSKSEEVGKMLYGLKRSLNQNKNWK